jgi:hypothetical protein
VDGGGEGRGALWRDSVILLSTYSRMPVLRASRSSKMLVARGVVVVWRERVGKKESAHISVSICMGSSKTRLSSRRLRGRNLPWNGDAGTELPALGM